MKISGIILFSFFVVINGISQSFAPIGAKWYYSHRENPFGSAAVGYQLFEVTGDTVINSQLCRVVHKTYFSSDSSINDNGYLYLYKNANQIYYLDSNHFELLYDFNLNAGDTLTIKNPDSYNSDTLIYFVVDSVDTEIISGITHKKQYFHDTNGYFDMFSPVIENIGSVCYFFPRSQLDCDAANCYNLLCYEDTSISFHTSSTPCDMIISSITTAKLDNVTIELFPNPATNKLFISVTDNQTQLKGFEIFNVQGKQIKSEFFDTSNKKTVYSCPCLDKTKINLRNFKSGTYYISIFTNNGNFIKKFVKQ